MGTNFYLVNNVCTHCDRYDRAVHLGKSSKGWTFNFRGYRQEYPEDYDTPLNVQTFGEWKELVEHRLAEGYVIKDEYGATTELAYLLGLIERKRLEAHNHAEEYPSETEWVDIDGNSFSGCEFS